MTATTSKRLNWIDQVKGFTIFLVVYGHNFPFTEKYIYSFHMPLFIMVAGFFHPSVSLNNSLKKRFKTILIPYFIWAFLLYGVWYFFGRHFGESVAFNFSPLKNIVGVFYAQGGRSFMDWGVPLWYLPSIYLTFLLLFLINKLSNKTLYFGALTLLPIIGFVYSRNFDTNLPWSLNIALVALVFYYFGYCFFEKISNLNFKTSIIIMFSCGLLNFLLFDKNTRIDMYSSTYGNEFYFLLNGLTGSLFVVLFFKTFPSFKFLGFIGKFSLIILVLQFLSISFIKLVLLKIFHQTDFNFTELEKFLFAIIQIILLIPIFFIVNKFVPDLNGGFKKI